MKHLTISAVSILLALGASAQSVIKDFARGSDDTNTRFIPGSYMKTGDAAIYFSEDCSDYRDDEPSVVAEVYDLDLNLIKTFNFQKVQPYSIIEERAQSGSKEYSTVLSRAITTTDPIENIDVRTEYFIDFCNSIGAYGVNPRVDGTTIYGEISLTEDILDRVMPLFDLSYSDLNYVNKVEFYLDESGNFGINVTIYASIPIYQGEWSTRTVNSEEVINFYTPKCYDVVNINAGNAGIYLPFSQTFFNDDEKFEYVRYKTSIEAGDRISQIESNDDVLSKYFNLSITRNDRDGDGQEDYRSSYYGVEYKGFEVVSEDGETIYSFDLPESVIDIDGIIFYKSNNTVLAQVDFRWSDEDRDIETTRFYSVDKSTKVAKIVRDEQKLSYRPNPASAGTPIEFDLPSSSVSSRSISITSLSGARVYNQAVTPGATKAVIPTSGLTTGVYLFTLTENGRITDTAKIIIR